MKAICFDMDGVLIDSEWLMAATEQEVCKNHDIPVPLDEWKTFKGKTNRVIFGYIVDRYGQGRALSVEQLSQEKRDLYLRRAAHEIKPIPGALEFLARSRVRFEKIGLTTSNSREITEEMLRVFKARHFFDVIVTGESVPSGKSKPDPTPYLMTAEQLGVKPVECYVIEDSDNGIKSGVRAGCQVIAITTSFDRKILRKAGAPLIVSSFDELSWLA